MNIKAKITPVALAIALAARFWSPGRRTGIRRRIRPGP